MNNKELQEKLQHTKIGNIKELKNVELIPVIRIADNSYKTENENIEIMDNTYDTMPKEWQKYVLTCFKQANIGPIDAVEPKSPFVPIDKISLSSLELILKRHYIEFYEHGDPPEYTEVYDSIEGSYLLTSEKNSCIFPGTMGMLSEITFWLEALEENTTEEQEMTKAITRAKERDTEWVKNGIISEAKMRKDWRIIMTGIYPVYYKYVNSFIYFTECNIFSQKEVTECEVEYKIEKEKFRKAIETAYQKLQDFNVKLDLLVTKYSKDDSEFGKFLKHLLNKHQKAIT